MQILLNICSDYANAWNLKFNENKCVCLNAGFKLYNNNKIFLHMNDIELQIVSEYLGLVIHEDNDFNCQIIKKFCTVAPHPLSFHETSFHGKKTRCLQYIHFVSVDRKWK